MIKHLWVLLLAVGLHAAPVTVTALWQPNTEPDLAGYVVVYGSESGVYSYEVDTGLDTTLAIDWDNMSSLYAAVKAYDTSGNVSDLSEESVWSPGNRYDLNNDGLVDIDDGILLEKMLGSTVNSFNWDPAYDLNDDGIVDIDDEIILESHFGERY